MIELIEAIRAAVVESATPEQKALGAQACRTILTALGAEPGKPITLPGAPPPHPLAGITADQALDLLIARLSSVAEAQAQEAAAAKATTSSRSQAAPQIAFVSPSPALKQAASAPPARRRPR